jgi:hypothetical protein
VIPRRMTPEFKAAWIARLRSGKVEQGQKRLEYLTGEQCCLGVAANLALVPKRVCTDVYVFDFGDPPRSGRPPNGWMGLREAQITELAAMNDTGKTFAQIADWIEQNIEATG